MAMTKDRYALMQPEMVCATLAGTKWHTRRVIDGVPLGATITKRSEGFKLEKWPRGQRESENFGRVEWLKCPYGAAGDTLLVKERYHVNFCEPSANGVKLGGYYPADDAPFLVQLTPEESVKFLRRQRQLVTFNSIFCFRSLCRIRRRIKEIRAERVQDISPEDAIAEGIKRSTALDCCPPGTWQKDNIHVDRFARLWNSINSKRGHGWEKNDWVWVVVFERQAQEPKEAA